MQVQTLSIVIGGPQCNAKCPFCVANMTPSNGVAAVVPPTNRERLRKALTLARMSGVNTVLLTGKGEPTLWPELITEHLELIEPHDIPIVELQTNGIRISENHQAPRWLDAWRDRGLTTVCLSVVHFDPARNREVYTPDSPYIDLPRLIEVLHSYNLSVRLSVMMLRGCIDSVESIYQMAEWAKARGVEQLTFRSISKPHESMDHKTADWVEDHQLYQFTMKNAHEALKNVGTELLRLRHGAVVYDYKGQNVCLTDCLTTNTAEEYLRQLIYFPDGHLRYDWQYEGAIIF